MPIATTLRHRLHGGRHTALATLLSLSLVTDARASLFSGETLDTVANVLSWIVLVIAPIIGIGVFWMVHILPERIAEQRHHPQVGAIKTLCLLSLFFGGLLWPLAWLWAYTKPVLHKIAYGTDKHEPAEVVNEAQVEDVVVEASEPRPPEPTPPQPTRGTPADKR